MPQEMQSSWLMTARFIGHVDRVRRAGTLAGAAGDAAHLAHRACGRASLVVGAEHLDALVARDNIDDVLLAHASAQATANAGLAVHMRHAVLIKFDCMHATGGNA